jgi:hypothetical protein
LEIIGVVLLGICVLLLATIVFILRNTAKFRERQLQHLQDQEQRQYELSKCENALSYSITKNDTLRQARRNLEDTFEELRGDEPKALPLEKIQQAIEQDISVKTDIICLLGHWENMALAIHSNIADNQTAFNMVASICRSHVRTFMEFIEYRRDKNRNIYKHLLRLDQEWRENQQ